MSEVSDFLDGIGHDRRRAEARVLDQIFRETTGFNAHLWQGRLIGYGTYDYTYPTGRSGTFIATGFSPLKSKFSLHILPGYQDFGDITDRLGKVKYARSCAYVNKLDDIDLDVLPELIRAGLYKLNSLWPVKPT